MPYMFYSIYAVLLLDISRSFIWVECISHPQRPCLQHEADFLEIFDKKTCCVLFTAVLKDATWMGRGCNGYTGWLICKCALPKYGVTSREE